MTENFQKKTFMAEARITDGSHKSGSTCAEREIWKQQL